MHNLSVYIAAPYTKGDTDLHVNNVKFLASEIISWEYLPFIPHLYHYMPEHPYKVWTEMDLYWLSKCDVLVRMNGESAGADREVLEAQTRGIPVYELGGLDWDSLSKLESWLEDMHQRLRSGLDWNPIVKGEDSGND